MRKLISALVFGALLIPDYAFTLGMGEIEVDSALNQQLNARIELISSVPEDAETLIIKLASREEFVRAGLDRPFSLTSLRFKSVVENGKVYINVTTPKPVREPFLNFLVEVDWPKGHLLREYTILLDPPVFMGQQDSGRADDSGRPAATDRPAASQPSSMAPAPVQPTTQTSGFRPAPAPVAAPEQLAPADSQSQIYAPVPMQQQSSYSSPSGDYRVRAGDTAWSLADTMRPDQSVSVEQMMLAMLRINPEVFINENVNGLKKGYILRIPDRSEITSLNQQEARDIVAEQNALWREYQQALGVDQPASAIDAGDESDYGSGIRSSSDSRLSIVSAGSGAGATGDMKDPTEMSAEELREQLALSRENIETERVEKEALKQEVDSLEGQVEKMKSLLAIEDSSMAEIQSIGAESEVADAAAEDATAIEGEPTETIASEEEAVLDALDQLTGEAEAIDEEADLAADATAETEITEGEEVFVDEQAAPEMAVEEEIAVEAVEPAPVDVMPRKEPDLISSLLGNPLIAGGAALLVLVLLAIGYIFVKRRRDSAAEEAEAVLAADIEQGLDSDLEDVADSINDDSLDDFVSEQEVQDSMAEAEAEAEDEFDAESTMILSTEDTVVTKAEPEASPEAEEDRDDVIAEADVYLAYGIYQQAEELLQNAISENPEKDSYRVKLAETYFAGKDSEALIKLGTEMSQRLAGKETPAWQKVVALGKELCPDADVFMKAGMVADLDIDDLMPKSPEPMDFDLGDDAGDSDVPDLDMDSLDDVSTPEIDVGATAVIPPDEEVADELEFDIGETDAVEEPKVEPATAEEEFSLDIEASELDIVEEEAPEEDSVEIDSSELDFDMSDDLSDAVESADAGLDFSMDKEPSPAETPAISAGADELDLSDLGDVDEVNTKLDLAKAYLDMGDHEGARDILDEVIAGGNDQQKQEAQELLSQID